MMDLTKALSYRDALEVLDLVHTMKSFATVDLEMNGLRIRIEADASVVPLPPLDEAERVPSGRIIAAPALGILRFVGPQIAPGSIIAANASFGTIETLGRETPLKADEACAILEVFAEEGSFVEYGQPLLRLAR